MEVIGLIDRIDDLILRGMTVPLTNQVRVERREVEEALSALRRALADEVAPVAPADRRQRARELLEPIDRLDELIKHARSIPMTNQVRLDREAVFDLLDKLRLKVHERLAQERDGEADSTVAVGETARLVEQLAELVRDARPVPLLGSQVRVSRHEVYAILDSIRISLPGELRAAGISLAEGSPSHDFLELVDRLDDLVHKVRPIGDGVRMRRAVLEEIIESMQVTLPERLR